MLDPGEAMEIRISELPELSKKRLLGALKNPPNATFVVSESRLKWAWTWLVVFGLGIWWVAAAADDYKWSSDDMHGYLVLFVLASVVGWLSVRYILSWYHSEFKAQFLVNPLYFLRFRFDRIDVVSFTGEKVWRFEHSRDTKGAYAGTRFYFGRAGQEILVKTTSIRVASDLIEALNESPKYVLGLLQRKDVQALYFYDLLYEWRTQNEQGPPNQRAKSTGADRRLKLVGHALLAVVASVGLFFFAISPYNDYRDDEIRWQTAKSTGTAGGYRLYAAMRPDGRHLNEANDEIGKLYARAADTYRAASADSSSAGVEVVIQMLNYAKRTGNYSVFVNFEGDNQIPDDIEERLRRSTGVTNLVPILPSFTQSMNQAREARILQKISESFGKVIPGDILQFSAGQGSAQDMNFTVVYVIEASGDLYYPVSQKSIPESRRDWYTGIEFDWKFEVNVPDEDSSSSKFSLKSEPSDLFHVAYTRSEGQSNDLEPTEVYGAMADSAFEDFGAKLLSQFAVN